VLSKLSSGGSSKASPLASKRRRRLTSGANLSSNLRNRLVIVFIGYSFFELRRSEIEL
jgi:hypothetical protein